MKEIQDPLYDIKFSTPLGVIFWLIFSKIPINLSTHRYVNSSGAIFQVCLR